MDVTIADALGRLDPDDERNWTADGMPRMDVLEQILGDKALTRQNITEADPEFCRDVARERKVVAEAKEKADIAEAEAKEKADIAEAEAKEKADIAEAEAEEANAGQPDLPEEEPKEETKLTLDEQISELSQERSLIDKEIATLQARRDALQRQDDSQHSPRADTEARMAFAKSQEKLRLQRAERGRKIIQAIGKENINPKSRLDQAMARKTQRGTRRPPARLMKQEG